MTWQCRLVEGDPGADRTPGDMWFVPAMIEGPHAEIYTNEEHGLLSREYMRDWYSTRPPLVVVLPSGTPFCMDHCYGNARNGTRQGWTATGEAPHITLSPSINEEGCYHGWLRDGVLSDDVEGRTFPQGGS